MISTDFGTSQVGQTREVLMGATPKLRAHSRTALRRDLRPFDGSISRPGSGALNAHLKATPPFTARPRKGTRIPLEIASAAMRGVDAFLTTLVCIAILELRGTAFFSATVTSLLPYILAGSAALGAIALSGAWRTEYRMVHPWSCMRVSMALAATILPVALADYVLGVPQIGVTAAALWAVLSLAHVLYSLVIYHLTKAGRLSENVVIVGATENARRLIARNEDSRALNIVGVFDDRLARAPTDIAGVPVLGTLKDLMDWDLLPEMDRIVVTVTSDARDRVRNLVDRLRVLPQRVVLLLDLAGFDPETESLDQIARSPAAYISGAPVNLRHAIVKRLSDIVISAGLLVAFAPVMVTIALAVWMEDRGPIFFRQKRHGFNNQVIRVWKFRSMRPDRISEERMVAQTFAGDTRITRVGSFIRRTSLDELPQLWNVLMGQMSIVGPRPHAVGMTTEQTEVHAIVRAYAHRHRVKPGITGWAQINGSRGPVHTKEEVRERVRLDLEYVNRGSLLFDLYIMLMTAPCLLGDRSNAR
ncbi:MAG: exopolysaccharide biosynthesis polyprenyl glycosylphosphotransferase [Pseudomonadota bacterium]